MKPKHLVLHQDVHQKLKKRKSLTGQTIQEIGNDILRAGLARPVLTEVIAGKLLAEQKLTPEEWEDVLGSALQEAQSAFPAFSEQVTLRGHDRTGTGAWRVRNTHRSASKAFEAVEYEANNLDAVRTVARIHDGHEVLMVLSGTVGVHIQDRAVTLGPLDMIQFDSREPHLCFPLDMEARILSVVVPALSDSTLELVELNRSERSEEKANTNQES